MARKIVKKRSLGKVFQIGDSFFFAAQIPDDSVGCSGSRCSNCGSETAYCIQLCRKCGLPFIGPFGFPQMLEWERLSLGEKTKIVETVYSKDKKRGRIEYVGIEYIPLTQTELSIIDDLDDDDAYHFFRVHETEPGKLRKSLVGRTP